MGLQTFAVSGHARVLIKNASERVIITGWDEDQVSVNNGSTRQDGDTISIENVERVSVRVPRTADLFVGDCSADVRIDDIAGQVRLEQIDGDVILHRLQGEVQVHDLEGDLIARDTRALRSDGLVDGNVTLRGVDQAELSEIEGDISADDTGALTVQKLDGDLSVHGAHGPLALGAVDGDVSVRELVGDLRIEHVRGDVIAAVKGAVDAQDVEGDAAISLSADAPVALQADGDVVLTLPDESNLALELDAPRGNVVTRAPIKVTAQERDHVVGTTGNGGPHVQVESTRGDVIVRTGSAERRSGRREHFGVSFGAEFAGMGEQIAAEVHDSILQSLADFKMHGRRGQPWFRSWVPPEEQTSQGQPTPPPVEEQPAPSVSPAERKAILDAIERGELSVDEAIRRLKGEG
ncbi:MAG: DUF4097 family beta strand repeat-containing protein [Chloroflexi bacterium]|nr:DUF4097 family beta strand repeat-containing protein [Chloroflexota bacterium]